MFSLKLLSEFYRLCRIQSTFLKDFVDFLYDLYFIDFFRISLNFFRIWSNFFQNFIEFLTENKRRFSSLQKLTIQIKTVPSTMSGKTVIAFLRHSNVKEFNWLIDLPFTDQDQVQLTYFTQLFPCDSFKLHLNVKEFNCLIDLPFTDQDQVPKHYRVHLTLTDVSISTIVTRTSYSTIEVNWAVWVLRICRKYVWEFIYLNSISFETSRTQQFQKRLLDKSQQH